MRGIRKCNVDNVSLNFDEVLYLPNRAKKVALRPRSRAKSPFFALHS